MEIHELGDPGLAATTIEPISVELSWGDAESEAHDRDAPRLSSQPESLLFPHAWPGVTDRPPYRSRTLPDLPAAPEKCLHQPPDGAGEVWHAGQP